jgi:uncharacterized protein (TIGR03435 family)
VLEEPTSLRIDDPGVRALFTESARFQSWLDVEAALAEAQAELGIIPAAAANIPQADGSSLMTVLNEQLGLKLNSVRAPVDVVVVDSVEAPTPD